MTFRPLLLVLVLTALAGVLSEDVAPEVTPTSGLELAAEMEVEENEAPLADATAAAAYATLGAPEQGVAAGALGRMAPPLPPPRRA